MSKIIAESALPDVNVERDWQVFIRWTWFILLVCAVVVLFLLKLGLGTVQIPVSTIVAILLGQNVGTGVESNIVLQFRLPHAVTAMIAGAALAVSGLQMQTLFRNPLAGPWVLGVVAGARVGVACLLVIGAAVGLQLSNTLGIFASLSLVIAASAGAFFTLLLIITLSRKLSTTTLLIAGLIFGYVAEGLTNLLLHFTTMSQRIIFLAWNEGSFGGVTWVQMKIFVPVVLIGFVIAFALVKALNALLLGEKYARTLGLTVARARYAALFGMVALAGGVTAFCGPIAFLDIAVPHICRGIFKTSDHRILVPTTALMGALLALVADLVTTLPGAQQVVHLNSVTALIGGPVVLWILLHRKEMRSMES